MKTKIIILIIVIIVLLILSFLPIWNKQLEDKSQIKINTWQKIFMKID